MNAPTTTFAPVLDWNSLSEVQAILELCRRLGISLSVTAKGQLSATGNAQAAQTYLADLAPRYKTRIIAHLLHLPLPETSDEQDMANIVANAQALDLTIAAYCTAAGHTPEHRDKLLAVRRRMAPAYLVQNLCAFRVWLYEVKGKTATRANAISGAYSPGWWRGI